MSAAQTIDLTSDDHRNATRYPELGTGPVSVDPFISPDETYLVFCSTKPGGYGQDDLYISFRGGDGAWQEPMNLGMSINSSGSENRPHVTLDGQYLFYTSNRAGQRDIYWVSTAIFARLKEKISP